MKSNFIFCLLVAITALLSACDSGDKDPGSAPGKSPGDGDNGAKKPPAPPTEDGKKFAATIDRLSKQANGKELIAKDQFDLAVALFGTGSFDEALNAAKKGPSLTKNATEKGLFYVVASQCYGAQGKYFEAANMALEGQKIDDKSVELADLRFAYFTKAGDQAQAKAAEDMLKHLAPSGQPVVSGAQIMATIEIGSKIIGAVRST